MIRFSDILRRITGISFPIGGIQWNPPTDQRRLAKQVLDELNNRRVLYAPFYQENEQACINSALDLRENLKSIIDAAPDRSPVYKCAKEIQKACRTFMSKTEQLDFSVRDRATSVATRAMFEQSLTKFRRSVGETTKNLIAAYELDVEDELAAIIPFSKPS
jgi:hypothetical protein